jgi:hypothetical protein
MSEFFVVSTETTDLVDQDDLWGAKGDPREAAAIRRDSPRFFDKLGPG